MLSTVNDGVTQNAMHLLFVFIALSSMCCVCGGSVDVWVGKHNTTSISVGWRIVQRSPALLYEVQHRTPLSADWEVEIGGADGYGNTKVLFQAQIVSVRVDRGKKITQGFFRLGLNVPGVLELDNELVARTGRIPFNADARTVKQELESIRSIGKVEVHRCDEAGSSRGQPLWVGGCPYGDRGGYRWYVLFQDYTPRSTLIAYEEELNAPWTGSPEQACLARWCLVIELTASRLRSIWLTMASSTRHSASKHTVCTTQRA
jgi:hypothetical protein